VSSLTHGPTTYVVSWVREQRAQFFPSESWGLARDLFEQRVRELAPGQAIEQLRAQYGALDRGGEPGGGIPPTDRRPVGIFNALTLGADNRRDAFLCFGPRRVPVLAPTSEITRITQDIRARDETARCDHYLLGAYEPPNRPPSELRPSPHAQLVAERCIREGRVAPSETTRLSNGELLWVAQHARDCEAPQLALRVAELALQRDYTTGALNIKASALRAIFSYDESLATYDESIELCPSAENNPYAHIGRAATLRRLWRDDEAYDAVKKALRFWPDDPYALRVRAAILRGRSARSEAKPDAA
jgi:tetratricopeptide (TPR) repeat protein